jgi:hypothetical protein
MSLFEKRVSHAVAYLHNHRADFTSDFKTFYGNHDCDLLIARSQDAFTLVGETVLNSDPAEWTHDFLDTLASDVSELRKGGPNLAYLLIWLCRDGSLAVYGGCTRQGALR